MKPAPPSKGAEEPATPAAQDPDRVKVTWNGTQLDFDQDPVILNDKTMVPLRIIFEAIGADIQWIA
jgi:hypothetical protein